MDGNNSFVNRVKILARCSVDDIHTNIFTCYKTWSNFFVDYLPLPQQQVLHTLRNGLQFRLRLHSFDLIVLNELVIYRVYDAIFANVSKNSQVIIDIGAHIGVFTILAAKRFPKAKLFAYEPMNNNFELLQQNSALNKLTKRIALFPVGVAKKAGKRILHVNNHNSGGHSFYSHGKKVSINVITLADIFRMNTIEQCDLLKVDCEGAEYEILMTAPLSVLKKIKAMVIELHDNKNPQTLNAFLVKSGFRTWFGNKGLPVLFALRR